MRWIGWLLCLASMAYLVYKLSTYEDYRSLGQALSQMDRGAWLLCLGSFGLIPVQLWIEALRWRSTLRGWKDISMRESWSAVLLGLVAGFVTPYRAGDIPARLVAAGLDSKREELSGRWHTWLKDWQKWFTVLGWTIVRYMVWGVQLWAVLSAVGVSMSAGQAVGSIALYYVMISLMPILPAADVVMKGGWAVAIFGQFTDNVAAIMVAVTLIWFFNTIIPVLFGSMKKILYFCKQEGSKTASL